MRPGKTLMVVAMVWGPVLGAEAAMTTYPPGTNEVLNQTLPNTNPKEDTVLVYTMDLSEYTDPAKCFDARGEVQVQGQWQPEVSARFCGSPTPGKDGTFNRRMRVGPIARGQGRRTRLVIDATDAVRLDASASVLTVPATQ